MQDNRSLKAHLKYWPEFNKENKRYEFWKVISKSVKSKNAYYDADVIEEERINLEPIWNIWESVIIFTFNLEIKKNVRELNKKAFFTCFFSYILFVLNFIYSRHKSRILTYSKSNKNKISEKKFRNIPALVIKNWLVDR